MVDISNNKLYKESFDEDKWSVPPETIVLLQAHMRLIENVIEKYLQKISLNFPFLTDHSIDHSRMLWNYADIIVGERETPYLNPLEAFVLHVAFLIHDSGMCYSTLNNLDDVLVDPLYLDYINKYGETEESKRNAIFFTVRQNHGEYALRVAKEPLQGGEYLIEDDLLRDELNDIIGKIAKSHSCDCSYIENELFDYKSPTFMLMVDAKKLAYILRTSDAAHLDNLRTPKTKKLIEEIDGRSIDHWYFQKKLGFPIVKNDLLFYNSNEPFQVHEQKAWWLGINSLKSLDKELRNANEFFALSKVEGFSAKGVFSINNPFLLGNKYIRTEGWTPIDSQIKVTNPVKVAAELGGMKLYNNITVAIREIIQNCLDAISLLRYVMDTTEYGEIKVSIENQNGEHNLIIADNGVGMTPSVMANELLDFGNSYWKKSNFDFDFAGIRGRGFTPIGQFGIGFFSAFMLGTKITVTSLKYGEARSTMQTLDFYDGLSSTPILRDPTPDEGKRCLTHGTSIKITLSFHPNSGDGLITAGKFRDKSLYTLVKSMVPFPSTKILVSDSQNKKAIFPKEINSMTYKEWINYIYDERRFNSDESEKVKQALNLNLELIPIEDSVRYYGKMALLPKDIMKGMPLLGRTLSNGIVVTSFNFFVGFIITENISSIRRDYHNGEISYEAFRKWAMIQLRSIENNDLIARYGPYYHSLLKIFDFYSDDTPFLYNRTNGEINIITVGRFIESIRTLETVLIYHTFSDRIKRNTLPNEFFYIGETFDFMQLVKREEHEKYNNFHRLSKKLISEVWGNFQFRQEFRENDVTWDTSIDVYNKYIV